MDPRSESNDSKRLLPQSTISHCIPNKHMWFLKLCVCTLLFGTFPDQRSKSHFFPELMFAIGGRGSGGITGEQMETCAWRPPATLNPPHLLLLQKYFCLSCAEFMSEVRQRGQPRRTVEIVWAALHDRPICRRPGVWLALWWQSFTMGTDCSVDPGGTFLIDGDKNHLPYNNSENNNCSFFFSITFFFLVMRPQAI